MTQFVLPFLFLHLVKLWLCHTITCLNDGLFWSQYLSHTHCMYVYACMCICVYTYVKRI